MTLLGNLIWILFGGIFAFLGWMIGGLVLCLTIVGIPFGLQAFKIGFASLAPFGREIEVDDSFTGPWTVLANVLWLVLFGWEIAVAHLGSALFLALTIVGIPFAVQHLKLVPLSLMPFGQDLR